jgi:hypothetical protein
MNDQQLLAALGQKDTAKFLDQLLVIWQASSSSSSSSVEVVKEQKETLAEVKDFLSKTITLINGKISSEDKKVLSFDENQMGEIIHEFPDLQLLEPRGRFKVCLTRNCFLLEGKSGGGMIEYDKVKHLILLPSHTTSKKEGEDYFAVILKTPVKICGKEMKSILFNLGKSIPKPKPDETVEISETESDKVSREFQRASGLRVQRPDPRLFRTVSNQKSFLRCHKGTQEGAIYPLECGIIFIKPLLFLGADEIASLSAGRGGGSGNTRFVDLKVRPFNPFVPSFF